MKDHVRARWSGAVLVCGKCSEKLDGGFGEKGRTSLAKALKDEPEFGKGRKASVGVIETKCLGICPKRAVMVVDTRMPDRWRIVAEGANVARLADDLHADPD